MKIKNICVFCGSSAGQDPTFAHAARSMGEALVQADCALIYGGGSVGLMGVIADAVLEKGGHVEGVIPDFLVEKEVDHKGISKMHTVTSMHERKLMMSNLSDAFIAMPGGFGTLEELFEILTWTQLGLLQKPVGLYNFNGFYHHLDQMLNHMVTEGFLKAENKDQLIIHDEAVALLDAMRDADLTSVPKWINREQT